MSALRDRNSIVFERAFTLKRFPFVFALFVATYLTTTIALTEFRVVPPDYAPIPHPHSFVAVERLRFTQWSDSR
jgi:hypothetical protein